MFFASLSCLVLASCDPKETKEELSIPPKTEAEFTRSYYYPATNETKTKTYRSQELRPAVAEYFMFDNMPFLTLGFVPEQAGLEDIHFSIPTSKLTANFIGEYTLIPYSGGLDNMKGDAKVQYGYGPVMNYIFHSGDASGSIKITAYDANYKMISGTYAFEIMSSSDPTKSYPNETECKISISGNFKNVPFRK